MRSSPRVLERWTVRPGGRPDSAAQQPVHPPVLQRACRSPADHAGRGRSSSRSPCSTWPRSSSFTRHNTSSLTRTAPRPRRGAAACRRGRDESARSIDAKELTLVAAAARRGQRADRPAHVLVDLLLQPSRGHAAGGRHAGVGAPGRGARCDPGVHGRARPIGGSVDDFIEKLEATGVFERCCRARKRDEGRTKVLEADYAPGWRRRPGHLRAATRRRGRATRRAEGDCHDAHAARLRGEAAA